MAARFDELESHTLALIPLAENWRLIFDPSGCKILSITESARELVWTG